MPVQASSQAYSIEHVHGALRCTALNVQPVAFWSHSRLWILTEYVLICLDNLLVSRYGCGLLLYFLLRLIGRRSVHIIIKKHLLVASSGFWWSATVHTQIAGVSCMIGHKLRNGFQEIFLTCALQAAVHRTRVSLISDSRNRFKKGCFLRHLVCNCYERPVRRRSFLRTVYNGIVFELHCAVVEGGRKTRAG